MLKEPLMGPSFWFLIIKTTEKLVISLSIAKVKSNNLTPPAMNYIFFQKASNHFKRESLFFIIFYFLNLIYCFNT